MGRKKKVNQIKSIVKDNQKTPNNSKINKGRRQIKKSLLKQPIAKKSTNLKEKKDLQKFIQTKEEGQQSNLSKSSNNSGESLKNINFQARDSQQRPSSQAMSQRPPVWYMEEYECKLKHFREQVQKEESQEFDANDAKIQDQQNSQEVNIARIIHAYKNKIELDTEKNSSDSRSPGENSQPSDEDIMRVLSSLEISFPQKNILKILQKLYNCLILKTPDGKAVKYSSQPLLSQPSLGSIEVELEMPKLSNNKRLVTKRYIRHPDQNQHFKSEGEEIRFTEKKLVAAAFVNRDYGIAGVEEEVAKTGGKVMIERTRYKTIASTVATDAYRKLEQFLIRECHRGIKQLNREEIRSIVTVILNCRRNFQAEDCSTFFKFMKIVYGIGSVTITEDAAIRLYISVQKSLKARMAEMQLQRLYDTMRCNKQFKARRSFQSERFQLHKIWTNQLEEELLRLYKRDMQLVRIRDHFKQKYTQHQHLFTIDSLRSRFHKILRVALRKLKCFCEKFGAERVPGLITLNDLKVKFILRSPDAMNARLLLVDMYLHDECDIKRLYNTVSAVNDFIIMKDTERMSQIIEAEPQIRFTTEKSNHNMAVSKPKPKEAKASTKDDVFLKEQEQNFDHFVQVEKGQNLHYYKISSGGRGEGQQIKIQEGKDVIQTAEDKSAMSSMISHGQYPGSAQQYNVSKGSSTSPRPSDSSNRTAFENIIKQQLQKYMRSQSLDRLSSYSM